MQRHPQAFAQRVLVEQPFELGEQLGAAAEVDPGRRLVLEQAEPDLLQTCPVGMEPLAVAGVDQDLAPEQAERLGGRLHAPRRGRRSVVPQDAAAARLTTWRASTRPASSSRV